MEMIFFLDSKSDFYKGGEETNNMIVLPLNEIQISFEKTINVLEHKFKNKSMYSYLVGNISLMKL